MHTRIDVHDTSGALVATNVRRAPQPMQRDPAILERVAEIIRLNSARSATAAIEPSRARVETLAADAIVR